VSAPGGLRTLAPVVLLCGLVLAMPAAAPAQCSLCKAALESSADAVGAQFNRAILVMMAGPYLVMGAFGLVVFRKHVRSAVGRLLARFRVGAGPDSSR
jgi:hypothetical protein